MLDTNAIIAKYEDAERKVRNAKDGLAKLEAEQKFLTNQIDEALADFNETYGTELKTKEDLVKYIESLDAKRQDTVARFQELHNLFENSWGGSDDNR